MAKRKEEMIIIGLKGNIQQQKNALIKRDVIINMYKMRLIKIRNLIDYAIEYPTSNDTGNRGRKHKRDIPRNQPMKVLNDDKK